ncbi:MAG: MopE-related protein [Myxococcales bacterium]|nr:MopE-related protein [Myxococcales bacterium]
MSPMACGGGATEGRRDASMADGSGICASDSECDDGLFCDGIERCEPAHPLADTQGCRAAPEPPCMESQRCDEFEARCLTQCELEPDADADGHPAISCGGDDCDDADAERAPGRIEICDASGHDEDCDPSTLGPDQDGDGYVSQACCYLTRCGSDCDDTSADINPEAPETCNGVDDDCDGLIDELVSSRFYSDCDGDGRGARELGPRWACAEPSTPPLCSGGGGGWAAEGDDCDDALAATHPGALELCNGVDDDCDGIVDGRRADPDCSLPGASLSRCAPGGCAVETCATGLDDCDGVATNGCETSLGTDSLHCGACGRACVEPNGVASCVEGRCAVAFCDAAFHICPVEGAEPGWACVQSDRPETCGLRCQPCPDAPSGSLGTRCVGGRCGLICASSSYLAFDEGSDLPRCAWNDPALSDLHASVGSLIRADGLGSGFSPEILDYDLLLPEAISSIELTANSLAPDPSSDLTITLAGLPLGPGVPSAPIPAPLGWSRVELVVTSAGGATRTYRVHLRRGNSSLDAYLKSPAPSLADTFAAVALSGDTLIVGAPLEDSASIGMGGDPLDESAPDAGAAYVYTRDGGTGLWSLEAYLKPSNTGAGDRFGSSVAIDGDRAVVGAIREDSGAGGASADPLDESMPDAGAIYVFVRDPSTGIWTEEAYLKASNPGQWDNFGWSVALLDATIVVGAPGERSAGRGPSADPLDDSAAAAGAVYVFRREAASGLWRQEAYLKASNTDAGDRFGSSVAIDGDRLVAGAPGEDSPGSRWALSNGSLDCGAAYLFMRDTGPDPWIERLYIKPETSDPRDAFGSSVALQGDRVAVGAPSEDSAEAGPGADPYENSLGGSGAAYVFAFDAAAGTFHQEVFLKASNPQPGSALGSCIAMHGAWLVVGASGEGSAATRIDGDGADTSAPGAGAAYLFLLDAERGRWGQRAYLKPPNTGSGDQFGSFVSIHGSRIAIGAPSEDSAAIGVGGDGVDNSLRSSGAAYTYAIR